MKTHHERSVEELLVSPNGPPGSNSMRKYTKNSKLSNIHFQSVQSIKERESSFEDKKDQPKKYKLDDFQILRVLGKGSFGIVKLVMHKESQKQFALKCLLKNNIRGKK